jgi:PleD family two-component response regulator
LIERYTHFVIERQIAAQGLAIDLKKGTGAYSKCGFVCSKRKCKVSKVLRPVAETEESLTMGMERPGKAVILLIELDEDTRGDLRSALMKRGYSVVGVENEEEALVVTVQGRAKPDLLILQMNASVDQILDTGRRIRRLSDLSPSVPIIVVPYNFGPAFEGTAVPAGEYDYICYVADPTQLEQLVSRLLG